MTLRDQFLTELTETPDDWTLRCIFADWCDDNNQPEVAACLKWMIDRRKRPYRGSHGRATWFNADTITSGLGDPESDIPGAIYDQLRGGQIVANHQAFASLREAEEAFYDAWQKARADGWNPSR